jgi:hypothetical protein
VRIAWLSPRHHTGTSVLHLKQFPVPASACTILDQPAARQASNSCTPMLPTQAEKFQKTGRQLRNRMWWANLKMKLVILLVVLLLAVVLFAVICFSGKNCLNK